MRVLHTVAEVRAELPALGDVSFVPTMGGLHEGHIALVRAARMRGRPVVASVFVNRLQFGAGEDFDRYPRTLERDCRMLQDAGCDVVFAPDEAELYPAPQVFQVVPPPSLAGQLEGLTRPGFFAGVCTVVLKLFAIVGPRAAYFGKKDYQQWQVLRAMVEQFALPIDVHAVDTVRAPDGLALSSRNAYLSATERALAPQLAAVLAAAAQRLAAGEAAVTVVADAQATLAAAGFVTDYVAVRSRDFAPALPGQPGVVLAAAQLGSTRLIDNREF